MGAHGSAAPGGVAGCAYNTTPLSKRQRPVPSRWEYVQCKAGRDVNTLHFRRRDERLAIECVPPAEGSRR